ncbi:MAG TPA: YciI family protein [bacterium]|jgi:hypothetical protein|nr:YciI family protein [bacterium]
MKFIFFVCLDSNFKPTKTLGAETEKWVEEMDKAKYRVTGDRLVPTQDAVTVKIRNEEIELTHGPFAVTETQIAGFDLIDCASLEEAIQIALKHPMAKLGSIEVRQFWTE